MHLPAGTGLGSARTVTWSIPGPRSSLTTPVIPCVMPATRARPATIAGNARDAIPRITGRLSPPLRLRPPLSRLLRPPQLWCRQLQPCRRKPRCPPLPTHRPLRRLPTLHRSPLPPKKIPQNRLRMAHLLPLRSQPQTQPRRLYRSLSAPESPKKVRSVNNYRAACLEAARNF
jgi:hypothetical protein